MATLLEIIEEEIFVQFRNYYFEELRNWSDAYNDNFDEVKSKLSINVNVELLKTKNKVHNGINALGPKEGVTYVASLKYQVENNHINNKDLLLLKYRDYSSIRTASTRREDLKIRDSFITLFDQLFDLYDTFYQDLLKFVDETYFNFQKGYFITDKEIYRKEILRYYLSLKPIFVLDGNFKISSLKVKGDVKLTELDLNKTSFLFLYLRKYNAILNYDSTSLAKLLNNLTDWSFDNLRKDGIGNLNVYFKEGQKKINKEYKDDLIAVQNLLKKICDDIQTKIDLMNDN